MDDLDWDMDELNFNSDKRDICLDELSFDTDNNRDSRSALTDLDGF